MAHEPYQRCWLFLAVDFSLATLRAWVAGMERGVCDGSLISARKRCGPIAPMTGRSRFAGLRLPGLCCIRQNGAGFLRISFPHQSLCHGMDRGFELLAFGFAERGARASIDNLVQFVQVHVDPPLHRHIWVRCSRKRGVKGSPRTSLIGRLGLLVWSFLPRPVVTPSHCQFAAR